MRFIGWILTAVAVAQHANALLEQTFVSFEDNASSTVSLGIGGADILVSVDDYVGVHIAANSLASDLTKITGLSRQVCKETPSTLVRHKNRTVPHAIIVGSINSSLITHISSQGLFSTAEIDAKFESFKTQVVDFPLPGIARALVITGSDKRGTIYGIHTLAEQCGQSPFHWFADVPVKKHAQIFATPGATVHGEPSIRYRGLFINDEEPALNTWWARAHNATRYPLDTEFYAHVFDLLLRLKANFMWPAMWKSFIAPPGNVFFTDDPRNQQLADDYGIVISTAHHEPMQRATNEWNETATGPWDWSKNKANMTRFMDEGVRRAGKNESFFTIGLRGLGDEAAVTKNAIEMLKEVFRRQRSIIKKGPH